MMKLNQLFPPRSPGSPRKKKTGGQDIFHHGDEYDNNGESSTPSSPLVQTTDGKTIVRLYVEILSCDGLGPDYTNDGKRITKTYQPYVKVKLGGNDDNTSLDIHKTLPVTQRYSAVAVVVQMLVCDVREDGCYLTTRISTVLS
jgi:hypothetical protein